MIEWCEKEEHHNHRHGYRLNELRITPAVLICAPSMSKATSIVGFGQSSMSCNYHISRHGTL